METCEHCGRLIGSGKDYWLFCGGVQTLGPDPFAQELYDDDKDYLMCQGERVDRADEI